MTGDKDDRDDRGQDDRDDRGQDDRGRRGGMTGDDRGQVHVIWFAFTRQFFD